MASHRSPNCPQISFTEAANKGRKVYEKEHTHPAPKAAVAEDLGYSGINGRALSIIGALRQYGILEGASESLRVTDDAVAFYELEDGLERNEALYRMVFAPPFFESLRQQFGESLPSEGTLKHHLIKEGFLPKAADEVIGVYRENLELVKNMPKRHIPVHVDASEQTPIPLGSTLQVSLPSNVVPASSGSQVSPSVYSISWVLSQETTANLQIRGTVTGDDLDLLRENLELAIRGLKRTKKTPPKIVQELSASREGGESQIRQLARSNDTLFTPE